MRLPRDLPGADLVDVLRRSWGYSIVHQRGNHILLETPDPTHHRVSVLNHAALRIGTLNGYCGLLPRIKASKGVTRDDVADTL